MSVYGNDLLLQYWAQNRSRLPAGYREVACIIRADGQRSRIDTGLCPDANTAIRAKMMHTTWKSYAAYLGNYIDESHNAFRLITQSSDNGKGYISLNNRAGNSPIVNLAKNSWHTIAMSHHAATIDGQAYSAATVGTANTTTPLGIFATSGTATGGNNIGLNCAYFQVDSGTAPVRDYVPCVRISDNKPGLYDLCGSICPLTNTPFYVNAGTGADFTWEELS